MNRRRDERGAVAVLVGLLSLALLLFLALVLDYGMAFSQRQALSTGADSAVSAVIRAQYQQELRNPSRTCPQIVAADLALATGDPAKSTTIALAQVNQNAPFGATLPVSAVNTDILSCVSSGKVLQAQVRVGKNVSTTVGRLAGMQQIAIARHATADLAVRNSPTGVKPIAICSHQAMRIVNDAASDLGSGSPYRAENISLTKIWTGAQTCDGGGGSGNWGRLDLGQGDGASALAAMIETGSSTPLQLTGSPPAYAMNGTPGNKGNSSGVRDAMATIMDKVVLLPVYTTYVGNGSNATYTVSGFLTVRMCGFDGNIKGTCYDSSVPMGDDEMQVRFVSYSTAGNLDTLCGVGESCAFDSYVAGMVG